MIGKPWYAAFVTAWHWGSFIAAHALVACVLIGCIEVVQLLILAIGDPRLFDILPLRYIYSMEWMSGFWWPLSFWEWLRRLLYSKLGSTSGDTSGEQVPAGILEVVAGELHRICGRCRNRNFRARFSLCAPPCDDFCFDCRHGVLSPP